MADILKVIIVDDETHARAALKGMIQNNFDNVRVMAEAASVPEAVKAIHKHKPDIVLLDIEMPGYLGVDILDFFDEKQVDFSIIFVTAYNEYALKAFELAAVDYLLKPTRVEHLKRAFERVRSLINKDEALKYTTLKENLDARTVNKIALQTAEGLKIVDTSEILYLKADSSYTLIFFSDGSKIVVTKTLQEYNSLEDLGDFMRIHRSYNINLNAIDKINKKDGGYVVMKNGFEIPISNDKRQQLLDKFKDQKF